MDIEYYKKLQNAHGAKNKREKELIKVNRNLSKHFDDTFDTEDVLVNNKPMQLMIVHDTDLNVYKKKIKSRHEDVFNLGDYVIWNDQVWLITLIDSDNKTWNRGYMYLCTILLRWQNSEGKIVERWCYSEDYTKYSMGETGNKLKEEREKLLDDYDKAKTDKKKDSINSDIEAKEKEISKYEDTVEKKIQKIQKLRDNFLDENDNLKSGLTSKQQAMYNNLTKVLDDYTNNDPVAKKAAALERIWDNRDFAKAQQSLVDKIRQGQDVSVDSLKKDFPELVSACDKAGISV